VTLKCGLWVTDKWKWYLSKASYLHSIAKWRYLVISDTQWDIVLNAAARLVSGTYPQIRSWSVTSAARRLALLHAEIRVTLARRSRTCTVQSRRNSARCQQHKAPQYLTDCVTPASDIASRQRLRSASRHQLLVPRYQLSSLGRRSFAQFAVAGPTTWNSLSLDLRDPTCSDKSFRRSLKTFLFAKY